jgi:hypothetical protein
LHAHRDLILNKSSDTFYQKVKGVYGKNSDICNYNTRRKLNFHVQYLNTALFKRGVINMGISLYNKVQDQIKLRENFNSFKNEL